MQTVKATYALVIVVLCAGLLLPVNNAARAQFQIAGKVTDSQYQPLAGVTISSSWPKHPAWKEIDKTKADGTFNISLPIDTQKPVSTADLLFTRKDYETKRRHLDLTSPPSNLIISLLGQSEVKLKRELRNFEQYRKQDRQHAIFISSFELLKPDIKTDGNCKCDASNNLSPCEKRWGTSGGIACPCRRSKSEQIHCSIGIHVHYHLLPKLSQIIADISDKISVNAIKPNIDARDIDELKYLGTYLNALAIITGNGSLVENTGDERILVLTTEFLIPNRSTNMVSPRRRKPITEKFSEKEFFNNIELVAERLDKFWAHNSLLALAEREATAKPTSEENYRRIIKYLRKASHVAENADQKKDLDTLIDRIWAEMKK